MPLDKPVSTDSEMVPGVEFWLMKVEEQMRASLTTVTQHAIKVKRCHAAVERAKREQRLMQIRSCARTPQAYPSTARTKWILEWPGQVVLAVAQAYWTMGVIEALTSSGIFGLVEYGEQCRRDLVEEVMLVRGHLRPLERATIGALVVLDVHARDVVTEMVSDKVRVRPVVGPATG